MKLFIWTKLQQMFGKLIIKCGSHRILDFRWSTHYQRRDLQTLQLLEPSLIKEIKYISKLQILQILKMYYHFLLN